MTTDAAISNEGRERGAALLHPLVLARASVLARLGRYDAAAELIAAQTLKGADDLDLLARIRVQQGRVDEAEALWLEARRMAPEDSRIAAALQRLHASTGKRTQNAAIGIAVAAVVVLSVAAWFSKRGHETSMIQHSSAIAKRPVTSARMTLLADSPGIRTRRENEALVVAFRQPLFANAAVLTPGAKDLLADICRRLRPYGSRIRVEVCGHADRVPVSRKSRYRDNEDLALARAATTMHYLVDAGLPRSIFVLRSGVDASAPASASSDQRTVVLHLYEEPRRER